MLRSLDSGKGLLVSEPIHTVFIQTREDNDLEEKERLYWVQIAVRMEKT